MSAPGFDVRALSLTQPWGWFVVQPFPWGKSIENRKPGFSHKSFRGPFYVHAADKCTPKDYDAACRWIETNLGRDVAERVPLFTDLERGGIIGSARSVGIVKPHSLPLLRTPGVDYRWHMPDQYGFELVDRKPLSFVECKGTLGFWRVSEDVQRSLVHP